MLSVFGTLAFTKDVVFADDMTDAAADTATETATDTTDTATETADDDDADNERYYFNYPDIPTLASGDARFSTLVTALELAGLVDVLTCKNSGYYWCTDFTVFAPTDDAFADPNVASTVELYTTNAAFLPHLEALLTYHVTDRRIKSKRIRDGKSIRTLLGEALTTTVDDTGIFINSAQVVEADLRAKNGFVHAIDSLLIPSFVANDIVSTATNAGVFTELIAAAVATGVDEDLGNSGLTVFAPTDDAFAKVQDTIALLSTDQLAEVLRYHVIGDAVLTSDQVVTGPATTSQGEDVDIKVGRRSGMISLNGAARVIGTDELALNGIIHTIDQVLLPPSIVLALEPTIKDLLVADDKFSTLETALTSVGLLDDFASGGPMTLFAPTDAAFAKLGTDVIDGLLGTPELTNILEYHILDDDLGELKREDLTPGFFEAENDGLIQLTRRNYGSFIINGNTRILQYDIMAKNGVIHVIDTVLVPVSIMEVLEMRGFKELVNAIDSVSGVREILSDTSNGADALTLFAPTNGAFKRLGDISGLTEQELINILTYHVVSDPIESGDLVPGALEMSNGGEVEIKQPKWSYETIVISPTVAARVRRADIFASNGLIHVISEVLLP